MKKPFELDFLKDKFLSMVKKGPGCWEWQGPRDGKQYGRIYFTKQWSRKSKYIRTHRWAWFYTHGGPILPKRFMVCHHCDNPPCVRPSHLFLGLAKDNAYDASVKGRLKSKFKGVKRSPEVGPKISKAVKLAYAEGRLRPFSGILNPNYQKQWTKAERINLREKNSLRRGFTLTEEHKAKIAAAHLGKRGQHHTAEAKAQISIRLKKTLALQRALKSPKLDDCYLLVINDYGNEFEIDEFR